MKLLKPVSLFALAALLILVPLLINGEAVTATYSRGTLHVEVPYDAPRAGSGVLTMDILNPEDQVVGHSQRRVEVWSGKGRWREDLTFAKAIPGDELVWHRLRYGFTYGESKDVAVEGTESISEILRMPVVRVLGQDSYLAGGPAAVRVIVSDSRNEPVQGVSSVRIELVNAEKKSTVVFTGRVNGRGTVEAQFRIPAGVAGQYTLRYVAETPLGETEVSQPVRVEDKVGILLTTEKPLYQPGQTIHARALALDRAQHLASGGRKLTFEVEDARGNKVFKKTTQTDRFGVASAEFGLAEEVNLGTYHLRAVMEDGNTEEMALNVERYVLPKFKVAVEFSGKTTHGYRPGDHVTGTVRANYFFGKAVDGGEIAVKGTGMDVTTFEVGAVRGKTDSDGVYRFDLTLPRYFAGNRTNQGAVRVLIEASVKDTAGHTETRGEAVTVSESPLVITAVPEGGTLVPNLDNQVFILTSYADGKPAAAEVRVHAAGNADQTASDAGGVAVVRLHAGDGVQQALEIEAKDKDGNRATTTVRLDTRAGGEQILLRTERAVYRTGERIALRVFSTKARGSVYVDAVKEGQTVLTRDVDLVNGQAELVLTATGEMAGTLDFNAYMFGSDARPIGDHRLVFVQPADELKIEATADAAVYRPGDDARIRFKVTNSRGEGVSAALGLQVVDEAVFALAEKQPGFAKVFFYLEQEVMKPRYEIHSIGMTEVVEPVAVEMRAQRERAARALFAATEVVRKKGFEAEAGREAPRTKFAEYEGRYQARFAAQVGRVSPGELMKAASGGRAASAWRDSWGKEMRVSPAGSNYYLVRSAGPDKRFDTWDDLSAYLAVQAGKVTVANVLARRREFEDRADFRGLRMVAMPMAMMAPPAVAESVVVVNSAVKHERGGGGGGGGGGAAAPRVRSYFPEALYINPEIITDEHGMASVAIRMADSITTWRMAMIASTARGALGSGTASLKVFQDFFVDLDLPVTLTQGDRVTIPAAVYNYSGAGGEVSLELKAADWYAAEDAAPKTLAVEAGRVGSAQFTLEAKRIGKFQLTLSARMGGHADIVVREIEVIPNGREQTLVFNGRLESTVAHEVSFPAGAIADASKVFVRLYPGPLSQVIEGMDSILRMPGGCFEQTSSSTYPNVLALDYMKRTKKLTPEVHAKAEGYIANGYQRLVTFEVPGGGFSWFGHAPANKILTAYGLMEFSDMAKVYDVDAKVISRTQQWLAGQQQADGSWKPDTSFINEGATNRYNSDVLRITAYIAWSLGNTGYQGPAVEKARQYVEAHMGGKADAYTLAVIANFAVEGKDREFARRAMQLLLDARTEKDELAWWTSEETGVYATGTSASVETTGLAVQALVKWGQGAGTASKALSYVTSKKDASGTWGTTQATIMALRALLLASGKGGAEAGGAVEISLNGKTVERLALTAENNDLFHQFVLKGVDASGANRVEVKFSGKGGLAYQVVGRYFVPWSERPANEALSIDVAYDRTRLAQDDVATATATVRSHLGKVANMVMVDLGIPPGFELLSEDLQAMQAKGRLQKFSVTGTQAILYFDKIGAGETLTVRYRLRAKFPIRARTMMSRVYEYYDPEVQSVARPVQLEVRGR